jgi:predicted ATPase
LIKTILFLKNGKTITPYRLSAGEKQILIILLKVILQENQPSILLMDEPELSLHLA